MIINRHIGNLILFNVTASFNSTECGRRGPFFGEMGELEIIKHMRPHTCVHKKLFMIRLLHFFK